MSFSSLSLLNVVKKASVHEKGCSEDESEFLVLPLWTSIYGHSRQRTMKFERCSYYPICMSFNNAGDLLTVHGYSLYLAKLGQLKVLQQILKIHLYLCLKWSLLIRSYFPTLYVNHFTYNFYFQRPNVMFFNGKRQQIPRRGNWNKLGLLFGMFQASHNAKMFISPYIWGLFEM